MVIAKGSPMLAEDINNLTFFPKGTILTFSSTAWNATSAEFKNIWKICNAANHTADNTIPDLTDKFLRGGTSSGATGGGKKQLSADELPSHTHTITDNGHTHTTPSYDEAGIGGIATGAYKESDMSGQTNSSKTGIQISSYFKNNMFDIIPAYYTVIYIVKVI